MLLPRFEYRAARTVGEAMTLWAEQPGARFMAGGTDLIAQMRTRRKVSRVIDVKPIPELNQIRESEDGGVAIGAAVTLTAICEHPRVRERYPVLVECASQVGAYALRNRATLAGNICNASPAADTAVALLALEAKVVAANMDRSRVIPIEEFFLGPGKSALEDGELVTEIVLPARSAGFQGSYHRQSRRRGMDLASVAVLVAKGGNGTPQYRVGLVSVAPTPLRARAAEELLEEEGPGAVARAAEAARLACSPITDARASAEYRREMVGVLTARGLAALA
ncbi:MAG: FAD binding domain-containing protein [Myxococcales bacterium]|jgi:CO/xanthine dehydrogenase FAD-binding subunit